MARYTFLFLAIPFTLAACSSGSSGGGSLDGGAGKDGGKGGSGAKGGTGGFAATGGSGAVGGSLGGEAGASGGEAGFGGFAGAAGTSTGGVAGSATGGAAGSATGGAAGSATGGASGSGGTTGGAGGTTGGTGGATGGTGGTTGGTGGITGGTGGADASTDAGVDASTDASTDGGSAVGDTCANPFVVGTLPFSTTGNTTGAIANYGYTGSACPGETASAGSGAADHVYAFTPSVSGSYVIKLTGQSWDSNLYVVTDCGNVNTSCIGADDDVCSSCTESLTISATGGTTYYIIVDGWETSSTSTTGAYTLQVEVAPPAPSNDTCAGATVVPSVPFTTTGDTSFAKADYGFGAAACPGVTTSTGSGANDVVYAFTPSASGPYVVKATTSGFDSAIYVATDCANINTTCLKAAEDGASTCTESLVFDATASTTYYIFVDGYASSSNPSNAGAFTLSIDPPAAGDTCANALPITSVPFNGTGSTTTMTNNYGYAAGNCPPETSGWGAGSNDVVYSFNPSVTGSYTITLGGFDTTLYVVTSCADIATTCVAGAESAGASGSETVTVSLTAGTTYYIIADGYANSSNVTGSYTLDVVKNP